MTVSTLAIALPWLLIVFGGWLFTKLLSQNGRILLRLEAIEDHLGLMSDQYAMFATPVAYLIDEEGIIAADAAVTAEAILDCCPALR